MADPKPSGISYLSPKRKRDDEDSLMTDAPSPSRLRTANLPIRPLLEEEIISGGSPRETVAGHLQGLDLDSPNDIPQLELKAFGKPFEASSNTGFTSGTFNPHILLPNQAYNGPVTPPPTSDDPASAPFKISPKTPAIEVPLEIPETPRLRPVSSPTPPPSATQPKPPKSPPPAATSQALWWSDSEITGHDPKDPSDDGYGINGVGFLPTPAIATARAGKRKKQVAEWKSREAREARQRRSDTRRRRDAEAVPVGNPLVHDLNGSRPDEGRKVRFLEI